MGDAVSAPADNAAEPAPVMPSEPEAGACCQSGCEPCIYDIYWAALDRYEQQLAAWKARQSAPSGIA